MTEQSSAAKSSRNPEMLRRNSDHEVDVVHSQTGFSESCKRRELRHVTGEARCDETNDVGDDNYVDTECERLNKYPDYCRTITIRDSSGQLKELVFPKALDLDRPKRARTMFSSEQLRRLEDEFHRNQYLVGVERAELASQLGLSETQIKVWFQNRRTKHKRDQTATGTSSTPHVPSSYTAASADSFYHHQLHPGLPPSFPVTCSSTGSRQSLLDADVVRSAVHLPLASKFPFSALTPATRTSDCDALPPGVAAPNYYNVYRQFHFRDG